MEKVKELTLFYTAIRDDHRIGTTHITIYMVLFQFYNLNRFQNPVMITRKTVMETAKISGIATYHKCMKELHEFGYIQYAPSYDPAVSSRVHLLKI